MATVGICWRYGIVEIATLHGKINTEDNHCQLAPTPSWLPCLFLSLLSNRSMTEQSLQKEKKNCYMILFRVFERTSHVMNHVMACLQLRFLFFSFSFLFLSSFFSFSSRSASYCDSSGEKKNLINLDEKYAFSRWGYARSMRFLFLKK